MAGQANPAMRHLGAHSSCAQHAGVGCMTTSTVYTARRGVLQKICAARCHRAQPSGRAGSLQMLHAWRQRFGCTHRVVGRRGWQTLLRTPGPRVAGTARQWRDTCPACADNLITRCVSARARHSSQLRPTRSLDTSGPACASSALHCLRKRGIWRAGTLRKSARTHTVVASRALVIARTGLDWRECRSVSRQHTADADCQHVPERVLLVGGCM